MQPRPQIKAPVYEVRLTIPAREALEAAGNTVERVAHDRDIWRVTLVAPPAGLEVAIPRATDRYGVNGPVPSYCGLAVRRADEPPWPNALEGPDAVPWWDRGAWIPCPRCGAALVWWEAGYVAGHRVCLRGHHSQLAPDGRSAKYQRAWRAKEDQ